MKEHKCITCGEVVAIEYLDGVIDPIVGRIEDEYCCQCMIDAMCKEIRLASVDIDDIDKVMNGDMTTDEYMSKHKI